MPAIIAAAARRAARGILPLSGSPSALKSRDAAAIAGIARWHTKLHIYGMRTLFFFQDMAQNFKSV